MILLFSPTETAFANNGLGALADAISCSVTEERNGAYELEMQYPITGLHYVDIANRCLIYCKPDPYRDPQPFRIYRITKPLSGRVTIYARHISYDLSGVVASPFTAGSAPAALAGMKTNATPSASPFEFWTDKTTAGNFTVSVPTSERALLGGTSGSLLDVYGGEYEFDKYTVRLWSARGQDSGVTIRYGKNLTDLQQDENISNVYTAVYPYYTRMDGTLLTLPEKTVAAPGTYDFTRILALDMSMDFDEEPSADQLRTAAQEYVENNSIGVPTVSLTVSFQPLEQTEEYKDLALLERVNLCDTVTVEYSALGVSATAKCVKTVYDALANRYTSVELGDAKTNIADTIADQQKQIIEIPQSSAFRDAINNATDLITGNRGGYVVLHDSTGEGMPDEILIMDQPSIETAQKIWRWNNAGLGYSSTGYNGPYGTAITQDGSIVANYITAGIMSAALIKAGVLQSEDGNFALDLENNTITVKNSSGTTLLSFSPSGGLSVNGRITSTSGSIGGFTIGSDSLYADGISLDADYDGGSLRFMYGGRDVGYIGSGNGNRVYISAPFSYSDIILNAAGSNIQMDGDGIDINGNTVRINGKEIDGGGGGSVRCGESSISGAWRDMPSGTNGATAVAAFCSDAQGFAVKTRYQGGWQWCIEGSSGESGYACWIAVD